MMVEPGIKCACKGSTLMKFVQPIILSIICESPDHGYNLLEKIRYTMLWQGNAPDSARIYHILHDMGKCGLVQSHIELGSKAAIGKRVFSITDEGRDCMRNWLYTLRGYSGGIKDVIMRLEQVTPNLEEKQQKCCCK